MKIAFTIEDTYGKPKQKSDPRYVKWIAKFEGVREGKDYHQILPFHKCTDEDYDSFYPVDK